MSGNRVKLLNPYLKDLESDQLYHIGFTSSDNLKELFGDVKVCKLIKTAVEIS